MDRAKVTPNYPLRNLSRMSSRPALTPQGEGEGGQSDGQVNYGCSSSQFPIRRISDSLSRNVAAGSTPST
jgi:hypothetical protein